MTMPNDIEILLSCLRNKQVEEIMQVTPYLPYFFPVIDGEYIPEPVEDLLRSERLGQYDLLIGANRGDASVFYDLLVANPDAGFDHTALKRHVEDTMKAHCQCDHIDAITQATMFRYNNPDTSLFSDSQANLISGLQISFDGVFLTHVVNVARRHTLVGGKSFVYEFTYSDTDFIQPAPPIEK